MEDIVIHSGGPKEKQGMKDLRAKAKAKVLAESNTEPVKRAEESETPDQQPVDAPDTEKPDALY